MAADRATVIRRRAEEDLADAGKGPGKFHLSADDVRANADDVLWLLDERERLTEALCELMECIDETQGVVAVDEDDFAPVWQKAEDALSAVSERKPA
jgi:hypothetical protein